MPANAGLPGLFKVISHVIYYVVYGDVRLSGGRVSIACIIAVPINYRWKTLFLYFQRVTQHIKGYAILPLE